MSTLSFWEQKKASNVVGNFKHLIPEKSYVIRDCIERYIDSEKIVVGDIVVISSGKVIPADMRILKANGLKIDGSVITGLKQAAEYISDGVPRNIDVFNARNIAFKGSFCVEGDGIGIVIRIGPYTVGIF
uniref:Uncharacterized protein n=1 Tax=Panagrolaimus sp. ES5 TaxID=591445 RepID=A0AC34F1E0_9BILA